jgi:hypothetical protein
MWIRNIAAHILNVGTRWVIWQLRALADLLSRNTSSVRNCLEAVFALETVWKFCGRDEYFCVAWNRATILRAFSLLLTYNTYLMRTYAE